MSLEQFALDALSVRLNRRLYRRRGEVFRELARLFGPAFWLDDDGDKINPTKWFQEIFDRGVIPDGWIIEPKPHGYPGTRLARVIAVEVEDTHKLSSEKLDRYADMWWSFDSTCELDLALLAVDRYGQANRWFNLASLGVSSIYDHAADLSPEQRASGRAECFEVFGALVHERDLFQW